ncbi:hypothetical protein LJC32_04515 [Oscillospiraceae bacterium OttesenSCG-928-F05]|nr:hypothetical protein [Oscillospiraceae bacterium OttesenSCG-928-F05]
MRDFDQKPIIVKSEPDFSLVREMQILLKRPGRITAFAGMAGGVLCLIVFLFILPIFAHFALLGVPLIAMSLIYYFDCRGVFFKEKHFARMKNLKNRTAFRADSLFLDELHGTKFTLPYADVRLLEETETLFALHGKKRVVFVVKADVPDVAMLRDLLTAKISRYKDRTLEK